MSSQTTAEELGSGPFEQRAGRKEWVGLSVLLLVCLLATMDMGVLYLAVPLISADLAPTGAQQLWIMDIYGLVLAGLLIPMGALGDRMGRRRLLLIGAAFFSVAALICAFAINAEMLIIGRALLGVAGATLMPSTLALIRTMFADTQQRRMAIAIWTAGTSSGAAFGSLVGGFLLNHFWWGSVFLIALPAIVLLLVLGPTLLPEVRNPHRRGFDLLSALLALGAVLPLIYGIKDFATNGFGVYSVAAVVLGVLLGNFFLRRQRILPEPVLDLGLFGHRGFRVGLILNLLAMFVMLGTTQFTMQYVQLVAGLEPMAAALWTLPVPLGTIVAASASAPLAKRVHRGYIMGAGFLVSASGTVLLSLVGKEPALLHVIIAATLIATGVGMAAALIADLILSGAPSTKAGTAAATSETSKEFGGALGTAMLGTVGAIAYTSYMDGVRLPGVPPETVEVARGTLGGAAGAAEQLSPEAAGALMEAASAAFVHQMNIAAIAATVVLVAGAFLSAFTLSGVTDYSSAENVEPAVTG